jgi:peptidoglycan/xylan/chitin deacetylase (PgdA/CDA1 family)
MKLLRNSAKKYIARIHRIYTAQIRHKKKEARFLVLIFFTLTFVVARSIVYGISYHFLPAFPFSYIFYKNVHIHHLVFGVILLLIAGFIRIPETNNKLVRVSSILYGIGAALTLDEFAIWLRLDPNAYFGRAGRISIDAVVVFTLIILLTLWYGNFLKKILLFTLSFFGVYTKHKKKKLNKTVTMVKKSLPYFGLGLLTFFTVVCFLVSFKTPVSHVQQQKLVLTDAIINSNIMESTISAVASISAVPATPSASPTVTPIPADFCLNIPVLLYHHVQPLGIAQDRGQLSLTVDTTVFDQQMQYLATHGYKTISAEELVSALHNHIYLPAKDVVVTLDDGYEDNYTDAFPIAKKYHVILNLMVPTGLLGTHPATNYYYTWDELHEMVNSGLVYAYDHTVTHYPVGLGTADQDQPEIMNAKQQLEQHLGKPVDIFTYPYGSGQDIAWLQELLQKDGFAGGFSTLGGTLQCNSFIMSLHRNHVGSAYFPDFGIY